MAAVAQDTPTIPAYHETIETIAIRGCHSTEPVLTRGMRLIKHKIALY